MATSKKPKSSKSESTKLSPILSKEAAKVASTQTGEYVGNPTQPHMARTQGSPRHTSLSTRLFDPFLRVALGQSPTGVGFDLPVLLTDVTGDGAVVSGGGALSNFYLVSAWSGATMLPHYRDYDVEYQSGHIERFSILVPGMTSDYALINVYPSFSTYGSKNFACPDFNWESLSGGTTSPGYDPHIIGYSRGLSDPNNIFPESAIAYQLYNTHELATDIALQQIVDNLSANGITGKDWKVQGDTAPRQKFEIIATALLDKTVQYETVLSAINSNTYNTAFTTVAQSIINGDINFITPFRSVIVYSENLPLCADPIYEIDGCIDPNNMAYWEYTGEDCAGTDIPAAVVTDPNIATWTPGSCCPDCINPLSVDRPDLYSIQSLTLNSQGTSPTTIGGTDGYIDVTILDGGFDSSGVPIGLPTGVASYTYVIQNTDATDTMCGNTAGLGVGSGAIAITTANPTGSFTFGNSVIANTNGGLLQNSGSVASATISAAGSGYTGATGVATTGGTGTGLTVNTTVSTGAVTAVAVNAAGSGYLVGDVITITGGGANATITVTTGSASYAASAAQGYVPGGTSTSAPYGLGTTNSEGFREGTYKVYVFDASTTVCLGQTQVTLTDPTLTTGCTDSSALNYDATAGIADNTACHYCNNLTGELVQGVLAPLNIVDPVVLNFGTSIVNPPTNTTSTDGEITTAGISPSASFQAYVNNIVSAGTQNADYIVELYKWDSQDPTGNANFGTLSGFNAATTIVGSAINNQGGGWNGINFTGFAYGYYSLKVYVSDPDAVVEIEDCYDIIDILVPVGACVDAGVATAIDEVVITDPNLYFNDPTLCELLNNFCCDPPSFQEAASSTSCQPTYESTITCSPNADALTYQVEFNANGVWTSVSGMVTVSTSGSSYTTSTILSMSNNMGFGDYRVVWVSEYSNAPDCKVVSNTITLLVKYGCTDSPALNYDAAAVCDDNSCIYCVYGCTDAPAANYNANATCDDGSCVYDVYGCTDITASNYDSSATVDDGSCVYIPCGCTDSLALNYDATLTCDDGSCTYCDNPPLTYSVTTTNATVTAGACLSNYDGCINLTVDSSTCTSTWTLVECYFFCGISNSNVTLVTSTDYAYGVAANICDLPGGFTYTLNLEDCNGCLMQIEVFVGTDSSDCGCLDPAADNYCPTCTIDDGSCQYCGCTDPNALNYNPGATENCDPDTCSYPPLTPPCIPYSLPAVLDKIEECISENGTNYYHKLIIGKSDECSVMNAWTLILIDYLLKRVGLDCIYNCADANTPDASEVYISCDKLWIEGGPSTGLNDPIQTALNVANGTTQGTHSTVAMFAAGSTDTLSPGDVIKHHNHPFNIWIFYGPSTVSLGPISVAGLDPENASGNLSGYWGYCNDSMRHISNENNINYLDNFINFANTFCRDCGNNMTLGLNKYQIDSMSQSNSNSNGIGLDEIGGIDI